MKILLINKFFYPRGGAEVVFMITAKLLAQSGNEVIIFSTKDKRNWPSEYEEYFVDQVDFNTRGGIFLTIKKSWQFLYSTEAKRKLEALIKFTKPDIAHVHNFSHYLTPSILSVLKKYKIPIVQTLHDYQLICPNYSLYTQGKVCERCKKHKYYNAIFYKCLRNSRMASILGALELEWQWLFRTYKERIDFFITPSLFMKNKMREWGVKNPIEVINNPIAVAEIVPEYKVGDFLYCVSRFVPGKGLKVLITAMKYLPGIKLKIAGNGPLYKSLNEFKEKLKVSNVEMLGYQTREQILSTMRSSRLVVCPSELYENYPTVVLEAFACGKPVIGSNIGGIPELVKENKTGWLFEAGNVEDLKNKIKNIWNQTEVIKSCGHQARALVEENNNEKKYLRKSLEVYNNLLNRYVSLG